VLSSLSWRLLYIFSETVRVLKESQNFKMTTRISRTLLLLLLPCTTLVAWAPLPLQRPYTPSTKLYDAHPHRFDIDVVFGSTDVEGDEDELSNQREQDARRQAISSLLKEQDDEFREERRKRKWGKYANATSKQDVEALEEEERNEIAKGMFVLSRS